MPKGVRSRSLRWGARTRFTRVQMWWQKGHERRKGARCAGSSARLCPAMSTFTVLMVVKERPLPAYGPALLPRATW